MKLGQKFLKLKKERPGFLYFLFYLFLASVAFYRWFCPGVIAYGDWYFLNSKLIGEFAFWPRLFESAYGIGSYLGLSLHGSPIGSIFGFIYILTGLDFAFSSVIFYYATAVIIGFWGMWYLVRTLGYSRRTSFLASLIYLFNSYFMVLVIGGQLLGGVSFGLIPWAILFFNKWLKELKLYYLFLLIILSTVQIIYDPRYFAFTLIICLVWFLANLSSIKKSKNFFLRFILQAFLLILFMLLANAFWLYGLFGVSTGSVIVLQGYDNVGWVSALSYSNVAHAALLHHTWWPGWSEGAQYNPEIMNIFLPLFVIIGVLFEKKNRKIVYGLFILALVGIFLAKGSNEPFGEYYLWAFDHVPGFKLFRDPSKFFTLIAFSYSILFALGVKNLFSMLTKKFKKSKAVPITFWIILTVWFVYTSSPLMTQQAKGTLIKNELPTEVSEYIKNREDSKEWYRVLWLPRIYRFPYLTQMHPTLDANTMKYTQWSSLPFIENDIEDLHLNPFFPYLLKTNGIKIVAIPGDIKNDIYRYSKKTQLVFVEELKETNYFKEPDVVTDIYGKDTYFFVLKDQLPGYIYDSQELILTDNKNSYFYLSEAPIHNGSTKTVITNQHTSLGLDNEVYKNAFNVAQRIYLNPSTNYEKLAEGELSWNILVAENNNYIVSIPTNINSTNYSINGQDTKWELKTEDDRSYWQTEVFLNEGINELKLNLENISQTDSIVPAVNSGSSLWQNCASAPIDQYAAFNLKEEYITTFNSLGTAPCLRYNIDEERSQGDFVLIVNSETKGENSIIEITFDPRYGQEYNIKPSNNGVNQYLVFNSGEVEYEKLIFKIKNDLKKHTDKTTYNNIKFVQISSKAGILDSIILEPKDRPKLSDVEIQLKDIQKETEKYFLISGNSEGTLITLNSSYDKNWALKHISSQTIIRDSFESGFGLTSFAVPANLNGEFVIYYQPAWKLLTASFVSLITMILLVVVAIRLKKKAV